MYFTLNAFDKRLYFKTPMFSWTKIDTFENELHDIFERKITIHCKKQQHQAVLKRQEFVHWNFLLRDNLQNMRSVEWNGADKC